MIIVASAIRPLVGVGEIIRVILSPQMCLYLLVRARAVSSDRQISTVDKADMSAVSKLLRGSGRTAEQLTGLTGSAANTKLR